MIVVVVVGGGDTAAERRENREGCYPVETVGSRFSFPRSAPC